MEGKEWLPKDRYVNESSLGRLFREMEMIKLGPFEFYKAALEMQGNANSIELRTFLKSFNAAYLQIPAQRTGS